MKSVYEGYTNFVGDVEKMHDFLTMSMEDFLKFYSYLDEKDYYATYDYLMNMSMNTCRIGVMNSTRVFNGCTCEMCKYIKACGDAERTEPCDGYERGC